jgi:hypothetical protein
MEADGIVKASKKKILNSSIVIKANTIAFIQSNMADFFFKLVELIPVLFGIGKSDIYFFTVFTFRLFL